MQTPNFTAALGAALSLCLFQCAGPTAREDGSRQSAMSAYRPVEAAAAAAPEWSFNATIIEACSCPMFCQCYFNSKPADHPGCCPEDADPRTPPRYCRFNNVFRVNHGRFGDVALDGAKFWVAGDLGGDFSQGEMNWAVAHFDPSVNAKQREGILAALGALYPVRWQSFTVGEDLPVSWHGGKQRSTALLDGGKAGEVVLLANEGMTSDPIVIQNLRYWGAPRNEGFVLMQNEVEAYRLADKGFEHRGTNGFMITVDLNSDDGARNASAKKGY